MKNDWKTAGIVGGVLLVVMIPLIVVAEHNNTPTPDPTPSQLVCSGIDGVYLRTKTQVVQAAIDLNASISAIEVLCPDKMASLLDR